MVHLPQPVSKGLPDGVLGGGTSAQTLQDSSHASTFPGAARVGLRSWASWARVRCLLGSCVGKGAGDTLLPTGNQDPESPALGGLPVPPAPAPPSAASPSPGVGRTEASSGRTQMPSPSLSGLVTRRVHLVLELALLSAPGNSPTYSCVFRVKFPQSWWSQTQVTAERGHILERVALRCL